MKSNIMVQISAIVLVLLLIVFAANPAFVKQNPVLVVLALALAGWKLITWLAATSREETAEAAIAGTREETSRAVTAAGSEGTVYVYRPSSFAGSLNPVLVQCDGALMANLRNGSYVVLHLPPGRHTFSTDASDSNIELVVEPGSEHYIRFVYRRGRFESLAPDAARREVSGLSQIAS